MVIIAFGEVVPTSLIEELIEDGVREDEITAEYIETLYFYEWLDTKE